MTGKVCLWQIKIPLKKAMGCALCAAAVAVTMREATSCWLQAAGISYELCAYAASRRGNYERGYKLLASGCRRLAMSCALCAASRRGNYERGYRLLASGCRR